MRIAICDDESEIRKLLAAKIQRLYPAEELSFFQSGEELLANEKPIDILFLDIQMPGKNGMTTAEEFRKKNKRAILIFVTALEEYVFQAFDVGAFHYLVKPFSDEKFTTVLRTAVEESLERFREQPKQEERCLLIKSGSCHEKVKWEDIVYAEVFNRKVTIHKREGSLTYYGKMSELETQAGEDFFRPHRAYLVNLKYVEKYDANTIYLEKGTVLMAKKNYPEFVKRYLKYNQRQGSGK